MFQFAKFLALIASVFLHSQHSIAGQIPAALPDDLSHEATSPPLLDGFNAAIKAIMDEIREPSPQEIAELAEVTKNEEDKKMPKIFGYMDRDNEGKEGFKAAGKLFHQVTSTDAVVYDSLDGECEDLRFQVTTISHGYIGALDENCIWKFDSSGEKMTPIILRDLIHPVHGHRTVDSFTVDQHGRIWIASRIRGIFIETEKNSQNFELVFPNMPTATIHFDSKKNQIIAGGRVLAEKVDLGPEFSEGLDAYRTDGHHGIVIIDVPNDKNYKYNIEKDPKSISGVSFNISEIANDSQFVWLAVHKLGLRFYDLKNNIWGHVIKSGFNNGDTVKTVYGFVFAGLKDFGTIYSDSNSREFKPLFSDTYGDFFDAIVFQDDWVIATKQFLYIFEGRDLDSTPLGVYKNFIGFGEKGTGAFTELEIVGKKRHLVIGSGSMGVKYIAAKDWKTFKDLVRPKKEEQE